MERAVRSLGSCASGWKLRTLPEQRHCSDCNQHAQDDNCSNKECDGNGHDTRKDHVAPFRWRIVPAWRCLLLTDAAGSRARRALGRGSAMLWLKGMRQESGGAVNAAKTFDLLSGAQSDSEPSPFGQRRVTVPYQCARPRAHRELGPPPSGTRRRHADALRRRPRGELAGRAWPLSAIPTRRSATSDEG